MVVHVFPAAKLGLLLLKHINRPITDAIRSHAKSSEKFRSYVCEPPARIYNWLEVKTKMWILNMGKPVNVPALNEQVSIDLGANLLSEAIILATAAYLIISEYQRSSQKEALKEKMKRKEITDLKHKITDLFTKKDEQAAQIREVTRQILVIEDRIKTSYSHN